MDEIVSDWSFKRIISAHFGGPVDALPKDFKWVAGSLVLKSTE